MQDIPGICWNTWLETPNRALFIGQFHYSRRGKKGPNHSHDSTQGAYRGGDGGRQPAQWPQSIWATPPEGVPSQRKGYYDNNRSDDQPRNEKNEKLAWRPSRDKSTIIDEMTNQKIKRRVELAAVAEGSRKYRRTRALTRDPPLTRKPHRYLRWRSTMLFPSLLVLGALYLS